MCVCVCVEKGVFVSFEESPILSLYLSPLKVSYVEFPFPLKYEIKCGKTW